jgi:hypothetical protein
LLLLRPVAMKKVSSCRGILSRARGSSN